MNILAQTLHRNKKETHTHMVQAVLAQAFRKQRRTHPDVMKRGPSRRTRTLQPELEVPAQGDKKIVEATVKR